MKTTKEFARPQWSSYLSYVLVTTGAVVGLGNIFHFPFLVAKWGGIFLLFYVLSEIFISLPLLFAELLIGRRGKQNPVSAISILSMESNVGSKWRYIGWLCFLILFLTLSYYTVTVAYPLAFFADSMNLLFKYGPLYDFTTIKHVSLTSNFLSLEICFLIFLLLAIMVIIRGINRGLEQISAITVPFYFIILFILAIYASFHGNFIASVSHLFAIPTNEPLWPILFAALTFAFFKLNVGMGSMIVYGSYLPYSVPLGQSTIIIILLDALASLLSYFIIYPLMLGAHLPQNLRESYENVMNIFAVGPYGVIIPALFFLAAVIAAWTPTIAMAESAALILIERFNITRKLATILLFIFVFLLGSLVVLSDITTSSMVAAYIQDIAAKIATPLSALLIAVFCGWVIKREITESELDFPIFIYKVWLWLIRFVAPLGIIVIVLGEVFLR